MKLSQVIDAINKHGMLLVFSIDNKPEPKSIWSVLYPKSVMRWEWDEDGDDRVHKLWHMREQLSRSGEVVYTKWFRGRATVFSKEAFTALLAGYMEAGSMGVSARAREILEILALDSPQSTKSLRKTTGLTGKQNERLYEAALKELWTRLLIVGYGEIEDGAFPSLAMGATKAIFEDLHTKARNMDPASSAKAREKLFASVPLARKFYEKTVSTSPAKKKEPKQPKGKSGKGAGYISFDDL